MEIKNVKISDIVPYTNNPRRNEHAVEYVKNSIKEFGFRIPMVLDKNSVIVCGHTRFMAAQELGMTEVPCTYAEDLTDEQIKAFRLADNKTAEMAGWDFEMLGEELEGLDMDMSQFGFDLDLSTDSLDDIFADAPEKPKEPKKVQCPHCGEWFEIE